MTAGTHPSLEDLALFAENAPGGAVNEIEQHLVHCEECTLAVLMHLEVSSAEEIGLAAESGAAESAAAVPRAAGDGSRPKKPANPFAGLFSGIAANVALSGGLYHLHAQPGLAASSKDAAGHDQGVGQHHDSSHTGSGGGISQEGDVRNASEQPSEYMHGRQESDWPSIERGSETAMHHNQLYSDAPKNFGLHPTSDVSDYVHQQYQDTCAIQCQHLILNQFDVPVTEAQLVREAMAEGIYTPGHGTNPSDVGKLLEDHGIAVHRYSGANVFNLAVELGQGHKVIVGVDSGSLWHTHSILDEISARFGFGTADHAVVVSGINTQNPQHPTVIITDPGTGDVAREYPLDDFLEAWRGSHFSLVSTADPAPPTLPEMANFDYAQGHISQVGSAPYEFVAQLAHQALHQGDPSVLARVDDAFLAFVHGHASLDHYTHQSLSHSDFSHAAADLLSAAHDDAGIHLHTSHFASDLADHGPANESMPFHDHPVSDFDTMAGSGSDHLPAHHEGHHDAWGDHESAPDPDPFSFTGDDDHDA
jgi:hypothetical protein